MIIIPNQNENYDEYINRILLVRTNSKDNHNYQERHHIVPKCLKGKNDKNNLIYLYPEEHYYAHKLLVQKYPDSLSLSRAWWLMAHINYKECSAQEYQLARDDFYKKLSEFQKGKPMPAKCIEAGRIFLDSQKQKVKCVETNIEYSSFTEAAKLTNIPQGNIRHAALGERQTAGGYKWALVNPTQEQLEKYNNNRMQLDKSKQCKPIICIDTGEIFHSCSEACEYFNIDIRNLSAVLNGKRRTTQNKAFEFLEPTDEELIKIAANRTKLNCYKNNINNKHNGKILCVELNKFFNNQSEAARELNLNAQNISAAIVGKQQTCGGYHWKYV